MNRPRGAEGIVDAILLEGAGDDENFRLQSFSTIEAGFGFTITASTFTAGSTDAAGTSSCITTACGSLSLSSNQVNGNCDASLSLLPFAAWVSLNAGCTGCTGF